VVGASGRRGVNVVPAVIVQEYQFVIELVLNLLLRSVLDSVRATPSTLDHARTAVFHIVTVFINSLKVV